MSSDAGEIRSRLIEELVAARARIAELENRQTTQWFEGLSKRLGARVTFFTHTIDGELTYVSTTPKRARERERPLTWLEIADWTPESIDLIRSYHERLLSGELAQADFDITYHERNGNRHDIAIHEYIRGDEQARATLFEGMAVDISERREAERQLEVLRLAVENAHVSVIITDTDARIMYTNRFFTRLTGYTQEEVLGKTPSVIQSSQHGPEFYAEMWSTLTAGQTWRGELLNCRKDGTNFWQVTTISPMCDQTGRCVRFVAVGDDVTDRKELERLEEDVNRILRHDLKSPLNSIIGLPQVLEMEENLTEDQRELIRTIEDSGRRMLRMIDSSLDLFKIEAGLYLYEPYDVDLVDVIREVFDHARLRFSARSEKMRLTVNGEVPTTPFHVPGEEGLVFNILANLITNAVEASPPDKTVEVAIAERGHHVDVAIRNAGAVPAEVRDHFFEKYRTFGKHRGTGLGTYSARLMAEAMGYEVQMTTSDDTNSTELLVSIPTVPELVETLLR